MFHLPDELRRVFSYVAYRMHRPDDSDARREYCQFLQKFGSDEEVSRRNAVRCEKFETGWTEGILDTELPAIAYYDGADIIVSYEIYRGGLPADIIRRKWENMKMNSKKF